MGRGRLQEEPLHGAPAEGTRHPMRVGRAAIIEKGAMRQLTKNLEMKLPLQITAKRWEMHPAILWGPKVTLSNYGAQNKDAPGLKRNATPLVLQYNNIRFWTAEA